MAATMMEVIPIGWFTTYGTYSNISIKLFLLNLFETASFASDCKHRFVFYPRQTHRIRIVTIKAKNGGTFNNILEIVDCIDTMVEMRTRLVIRSLLVLKISYKKFTSTMRTIRLIIR